VAGKRPNAAAVQQNKSAPIKNETPKERMDRLKREKADARAQEVAQAAKGAKDNY